MRRNPTPRAGAAGWRSTLALLLGSLVFSLLLAELVVRVVLPLPPGFSYVRSDGLLLHPPLMQATYFRQEFRTDIRINSLGLRGPEVTRSKAPGTLRILALGDSFTEGSEVPWEDVLSARLERALNAEPGPRVEVINAGVRGYGTADELLLLERLGFDLSPDLILLGFCVHNDVSDNQKRRLYDFSSTPPKLQSGPPPGRAALAFLRVKESLSRRSNLYQAMRLKLAGMQRADATIVKLGLRRAAGNAPAQGLEEAEVDSGYWFLQPMPDRFARGLEYTGLLLARMREESAERGIPIIVYFIPTREQVESERWERLKRSGGFNDEDRSRPQQLLTAIAGRLGIESVDPLPRFLDASPSTPLYYRVDAHWRSEGHRLAAEALLPSLRTWRAKARAAARLS
jgi:lysophospholipase L1-like esterase